MNRREFLLLGTAATMAPSLMACGDTGTGPVPEDGRLTARPGIPTVEPLLGPQPLGLAGGRDGILYVPETYDPGTPAPLFVALHGASGRASNWQSYYARSEARGMILLALDSRFLTWDLIWDGAVGPDGRFMDKALAHTFERVRVDPGRLALGGFSDGASESLTLGAANGDLFSHLVAYSPGRFEPEGTPRGRPRVFVSHGTQDSVIEFDRSRSVIVPKLEKLGYDVTFHEFEGEHGVPAAVSETALDWFLT